MIKVLHIANTAFFVDRLLKDKLDGLEKCGFSPIAAAPEPVSSFPSYLLPVARTISPAQDLHSYHECLRIIRKSGCDLVHTHSAKAGFIGRAAAYTAGIPCVHTAHGLPFYDEQNPAKKALYRRLEQLAAAMCDLVLCQNHADVETLRALVRTPVRYEGNEVNAERIQSYSIQRQRARERLGLLENEVAIALFARIEPIKRHDVFIKAFAAMNSHAVVIMAGKGIDAEYTAHIQKLIQNSGKAHRFLLAGFQQDPLSLLCACDIAALTSEKEGMPRILMEAMAMGIPVCATAAGGTKELVRHGITGLLSPVNDAEAFAENLDMLCQNTPLRRELGANAQLYARHELQTPAVINRIAAAYHHVLNHHSVR